MTRPTETTAVVHAPKLDVLPTQDMTWENFEILLCRLAREVRGLWQVRRYGIKGQSQHGIDIVGRVTDSTAS